MKYQKIECEYCKKLISKTQLSRHLLSHKEGYLSKTDIQQHVTHEGLNCIYCGKECKNKNSLAQHEIRCKENPNRINTINEGFNSKGRKAWNKGLTKDTSEIISKCLLNYRINYNKGKYIHSYGHKQSDETKKILSDYAKKNGLGGFHFRRGLNYNGVKLDFSFELVLAINLDKNNINWIRPKSIWYKDLENKEHRYTPDFYLPDYDVYLDPKNDFLINNVNPSLGYKDIDKIHWVEEQNNIKILILTEDQLDWNVIKKLL